MILAAATLYGFGKTFFWPTMLGVVAEQFPKGGALTLNMIGGVGMLAVGVLGAALLRQHSGPRDRPAACRRTPAVYARSSARKRSACSAPTTRSTRQKVAAASKADQERIKDIQESAKKSALPTVAIFPCIMLVCYLILILYFWSRGGYHAQVLLEHKADDAEFTGGVEGPAEL